MCRGKLIWVYLCGEDGYQVLLGCDVVYIVANNTLLHVGGRRLECVRQESFFFYLLTKLHGVTLQ